MARAERATAVLRYRRGRSWAYRSPEAWGGVSDWEPAEWACGINCPRINVSFIDKEGVKHDFQVAEGNNLLEIAQANDLEMEGVLRACLPVYYSDLITPGACEGSCACSTCHVIVEDPDMFDKTEEPSDDENDMLDLAFGLTETSRLGCQVQMNKSLDGMVVRLPAMTRNMQASDFQEKK